MSKVFKEKLLKEALRLYAGEYVLNKVLKQGYDFLKLGGKKEEVTVYFQDVTVLPSLSERIDPMDPVRLTQDYLNSMTDCVNKYGGILDKYTGDSFSAFWSNSDHPIQASSCALECLNAASDLSKKWSEKGLPEINIQIGIDSGSEFVGNMGSVKRLDYTTMGDATNSALSFVSANKMYGSNIIIGEQTYNLVKEKFVARPLGRVQMKGMNKPVMLLELIGSKENPLPQNVINMLPLFVTGYKHYLKQDWKKAVDCFTSCLESVPDDGPSRYYLKRRQGFTENPSK